MSDEDDEPILIACSECSNRIQTSFSRLRETATLSCSACGHEMARERSQVLDHIRSIRKAVAEAGG
jgi:ribosomal protein S27E